MNDEQKEILKNIKVLIMDVDGVLTDGAFMIDKDGNESKSFCARDGLGLRILREYCDVKTALISGRNSLATIQRGRDLAIDDVNVGVKNKLKIFRNLLAKYEVTAKQCCYIGDDYADIPVLANVGFSVLVGDAPIKDEFKVDMVTKSPGGKGAVREIVDLILDFKGKKQDVLNSYLKDAKMEESAQD